MYNIVKRFILFIGACTLIRVLLAYYAKVTTNEQLVKLGYIALLPAIGFMYIYLTKSRDTGPETFGSKIWWNDLRPFHSLMYFMFAYYAINKNRNAYKFLVADVAVGFLAFLNNHFKN